MCPKSFGSVYAMATTNTTATITSIEITIIQTLKEKTGKRPSTDVSEYLFPICCSLLVKLLIIM